MRINTNLSALNTQRILGQTNATVAKQIGRLSSGYRINKAADDAAGLGIANRLRADLRSMRQASRNAEQATSMLQVAEGGAQTIQNILERMKELATQSASDNVDASARSKLNDEFTSLRNEIDRIANTTKFQDSVMLDGSFGATVGGTFTSAIAGVADVKISGAKADTYNVTIDDASVTIDDGDGRSQTLTFSAPASGTKDFTFDTFGITIEIDASVNLADGGLDASTGTTITVSAGNSVFMVGSSREYSNEHDLIQLGGLDLTATTLTVDGDDLLSQANAVTALGAIDVALGKVGTAMGDIGAAQNRIDYARQSTDASIENIAAAESVIRDADMAVEMTELSRVQILQQAGTAMLAQANSAPQAVLQLLR